MPRPVDCAGRSDARLKEPTPQWCHELPPVQCERHFVHFKRERKACQLESGAGRCSLGTACLANFSSTSGARKQEGALHRAAMRWLDSMHPDVITAGQPGMRIKHGFPDVFVYEVGAAGEHGLGIEFKINTTRLSAAQRAMRNQLSARGYVFRVVRSLPEFVWVVDNYLPVLPGATQCFTGLVARGRTPPTCNLLPHRIEPSKRQSEGRRLQAASQTAVDDSRAAVFSTVFSKKLWGVGAKKRIWGRGDSSSGRHHGSGAASTLPATLCTREALLRVLRWVGTQLPPARPLKMLDVPCGDMTWMPALWHEYHEIVRPHDGSSNATSTTSSPISTGATGATSSAVDGLLPLLPGRVLDYQGVDIVAPLIEYHRQSTVLREQAARSSVRASYAVHDIVSKPLPQAFDLVFTKDMMIHLRTADALQALQHFASSGSRFLLATTNPSVRENKELPGGTHGYSQPGAGRDVNLELTPFNLTAPLCRSMQFAPTDAQMFLWDLADVRRAFSM